jgi:hypothetical protein
MTMNPSAIDEVAKLLVRARQTGERLDALPPRLKPENFTRFLRGDGRGR